MRIRLTWIAAVLTLVAMGFLVACSTKYTKSSNGLVVVVTEASPVMQTFSLNLGNGQLSQINNANGPPIPGIPGPVVIDPAGAFAYVASTINCVPQNLPANTSLTAVQGAIVSYKISSDGKLSAGTVQYLKGNAAYPAGFPACGLDDSGNPNAGNPVVALTIDSTGKYLFVATAPATATYTINLNTTPVATLATLNSTGVAVFAIGANASLTEVPGSPFALPPQDGQTPAPSALAVTPTVYPAQFAFCSGHAAPTTENLYVTDSVNYLLLNYSVNMSTGVLSLTAFSNAAPGISTGTIPSGVAVDPCNRFVYVSNERDKSVSAYNICSAITPSCQRADFSLQPVTGSPFPISPGDSPGPLAVDPFGNFLYVVDGGSSQLSAFRIGSGNGGLTSIGTYATGTGANSIAIRGDDTWIFVANLTSSTLSEYAIVPASGTLAPQAPVTTLNTPTGVAVK